MRTSNQISTILIQKHNTHNNYCVTVFYREDNERKYTMFFLKNFKPELKLGFNYGNINEILLSTNIGVESTPDIINF